MQTKGKFEIISMETGESIVHQTLEEEKKLTSIFVLRSKGQYLLITNNPSTSSFKFAPGGKHVQGINGRVYAFDRTTGKPQWAGPARISQLGMPLDQPSEVPLLLFLRNVNRSSLNRNGSRTSSRTRTAVLCIDRRDGRVLFAKDDIATLASAYKLTAHPEKQTVYLQLPNVTFEMKFTDEPIPPAPPAQAGQASNLSIGRQ